MRESSRQPSGRLWLFRFGAVLLGLALLVGFELLCRVVGWGRPDDVVDPFVGFQEIRPLFVLDAEGEHGPPGTRFHVAPGRRLFFADDSFLAQKPRNGVRIFCLGGSTVQGRPFSKETSFTAWLRLALEAADSRRTWEVVNCGGVSYASYRLVPILKECLSYQPDLFVICTGHNEFLEDRTYGRLKQPPAALLFAHRLLARTHSYWLLRQVVSRLRGEPQPGRSVRPLLPAEVDALLDHQGGLELYRRDAAWRAAVVAHFEFNVGRMVSLARRAGVPVVLVLPPSNLADCPPFKSQHRDGLTEAERTRWQKLVSQARSLYRSDLSAAVELLRQALQIDDRFAATWFELGKCLETLGRYEEARAAFVRARDEDICPLRMSTPLQRALRRVARQTATPLIDAHALLEQHSPEPILGDYLLVDHVHPSFRGHQMIANRLCRFLAERGWVELPPDWPERRDRRYASHFESLDRMYFLRGERTLETLRAWAAGRAQGPPLVRPESDHVPAGRPSPASIPNRLTPTGPPEPSAGE